jgi:hypothetical protein
MLAADQLQSQIAAYTDDRISLAEFEDWFREASENAHLWADSASKILSSPLRPCSRSVILVV